MVVLRLKHEGAQLFAKSLCREHCGALQYLVQHLTCHAEHLHDQGVQNCAYQQGCGQPFQTCTLSLGWGFDRQLGCRVRNTSWSLEVSMAEAARLYPLGRAALCYPRLTPAQTLRRMEPAARFPLALAAADRTTGLTTTWRQQQLSPQPWQVGSSTTLMHRCSRVLPRQQCCRG